MGQTKTEREATKAKPSDEQAEAALGTDKGYIGQDTDPIPNEAFSQETDPTTSPSAAESRAALSGDDGGAAATEAPSSSD